MMVQNALSLNKLFLPHDQQIAEVPLNEFHDDYQKDFIASQKMV